MEDPQHDTRWPEPKFYFQVTVGDRGSLSFQEVSGLDMETDTMEYRHGNSPTFGTVKKPGIAKAPEIILRRGTLGIESALHGYFGNLRQHTLKRENIQITLVDEFGEVTLSWTLQNAYPIRLSVTEPDPETGEMVIEEMVFTHEGITIGST